MTRYQKSVGGGGEPVEGFPMDFKDYGYELARPGPHKGIVLMLKEDAPNKYRCVLGIAIDRDGRDVDPEDRGATLVQVNCTLKVGTSWFDNMVETFDQGGVIELREGDDLERVDWRAARGAIVEFDLDNDTYTNKEGEVVDTNRVTKFLRARRPNVSRGSSNGRDRDDRGRSDDRRPSRSEEKAREKGRRAGPWGGGDDRGRRDERPHEDDRSRRDDRGREDSRREEPRGGGGYGKTYGGRDDDRGREPARSSRDDGPPEADDDSIPF